MNDGNTNGRRIPVWRCMVFAVSLTVALFFSVRIATRPVEALAATVSNEIRTETRNIEDIKLGMRVVGRNPLRDDTSAPAQISADSWREIHLTMIQSGTEYKLSFLRSTNWLAA